MRSSFERGGDKSSRANPARPDMLSLLLKDISELPVIAGKAEYLPLTRRIERGRQVVPHTLPFQQNAFQQLRQEFEVLLSWFNANCRACGTSQFGLNDLDAQIEDFFSDPHTAVPLALQASIGHRGDDEEFRRAGWKCFYFASLFTHELRPQAFQCDFDSVLNDHIERVICEYEESRKTLLQGTLRYVLTMATRYVGRGLDFSDLFQEGYFGLVAAVDKFSESEGAHFQSYAATWIRQRITRAIADQGRLIRIPIHMQEKLARLREAEQEHENELIFDENGLDDDFAQALDLATEGSTTKGRQRIGRLRQADAQHYSIERLNLDECIVSAQSTDEIVELRLISEAIDAWLERFSERERTIIELRTGLRDGESRTLEEIGQMYGLTRERIRQIEVNARKRMTSSRGKQLLGVEPLETDPRIVQATIQAQRQLCELAVRLDDKKVLRPYRNAPGRGEILRRMEARGLGGNKRMSSKRRRSSRVAMFREILAEAGHPLHHEEIRLRALDRLPEEEHFAKELAYASLFYHDSFRLLGNGIFGLASWRNETSVNGSGHVFSHCPSPLLPANASSRAFFETIVVGKSIAQQQPDIGTMQFYEAMVSYVGRDSGDPQGAFDAWYMAGLHSYVDFSEHARSPMHFTEAVSLSLSELRYYCLEHVCQRVLRMPVLLSAIDRLATTDISTLQKVVFGSETSGFDVPIRLAVLEAFEAVRRDGHNWRLTDIGRRVLAAHPPQELPDFGVIDSLASEEDETDDFTDDFSIFTL